MRVNDMAQMLQSDPDYVKRFFGQKTKERSVNLENLSTSANSSQSAPAPNWGIIPTKNSNPRLSDEEYENAIRELARKEASEGILASTDARRELRREYVSVVSPDRRSWFSKGGESSVGMKGDPLKPSMHYNKMGGMWFFESTAAEKARKSRFTDIYTQAFSEYEAEYGKVEGTPHIDHWA